MMCWGESDFFAGNAKGILDRWWSRKNNYMMEVERVSLHVLVTGAVQVEDNTLLRLPVQHVGRLCL